jgi:hypothetical protein
MPRDIEEGLQALLDSGSFRRWTAIVITLGNGTVLRFSRAEFEAGGHTFLARLGESGALLMSLQGQSTDRQDLKANNVDKVLGQQVIGAGALDGATAMLAVAFQHRSGEGPIYYVEKMPGDIVSGAVNRPSVKFSFVGELYGAIIAGEKVGAIFPYQDTAQTAIAPIRRIPNDPNDLPDPNDPDNPGRRRGRLPIIFGPGTD